MTAVISVPGVVFILYLIIIRHDHNIQLKAKLFKQKTRNFACIGKNHKDFKVSSKENTNLK